MSYIEKDKPGEYFNPTSSTVVINDSNNDIDNCSIECSCDPEEKENLDRWDWIISGWNKMTFKEKMSLFTCYYHYVNLREYFKVEFDERLNDEVVEWSYKLCRELCSIKFDPDHQGIPNIILEFSPVDINMIPNEKVKREVIRWGQKYKFIYEPIFSSTDEESSHTCSCGSGFCHCKD